MTKLGRVFIMIGWKCDAGYTDVQYANDLNRLSQITFLDFDRYVVWYEAKETQEYISVRSDNPTEIYESIKSVFGDGADAIYSVFRSNAMTISTKEGLIDDIGKLVPSISLGFPNCLSYILSDDSSHDGACMYFKSLKRLLVSSIDYSSASSGNALYEVNEDGSLTLLSNNGSYRAAVNTSILRQQSSSQKWTDIYLYFIVKSGDNIDYSDVSSYYANSVIAYNSYGTDRYRFKFNNADFEYPQYYSQFFKDLFGVTQKPDFNTNVPDNPYGPGGDSGEGGGNGSFDGDSDQISDSSLPSLSSSDTGFTRLYTPTLTQVQSLARYLWTDESIVETVWNVVKRYFEDPMQAFISFSIVPVPVPIAGQEEFKVLFIPTGVMLNTVANQFVDVDCGTFELKEYYGSALDYSPNTKVSCYLPYIGTVSLNTDDVMGRTLQVKYRVDICSGSCVAKVLVDGNVIYQFPGCCSIPIPFSSSDFSSYGSAIISAVKTGVAVASAGAGMAELGASIVGMDASQQSGKSITTTVQTARNPSTGRQITTGTEKVTKEIIGTEASLSGIAQTGISNTANSVTASKTIVERSGSFSGNSGYLGVRRPYLIIERPRMCMPANYQSLNGFPSMITLELGSCEGFTRVQQVQLTGLYATNPEQAEILQLLKSGVIF